MSFEWIFKGMVTPSISVKLKSHPFYSPLIFNPLSSGDISQYSCRAMAHSSLSQYITESSPGLSQSRTLIITGIIILLCIHVIICVSLTCSDLPPPNVSISFSGDSSAGQQYTMNCSATAVSGLISNPDMKIVFPDSTVLTDMSATSVQYIFSPLRTSDGGQYNCTATINIPQAGIANLNTSKLKTITVSSQFVISIIMQGIATYFYFYTVPTPTVTLKGSLPFNSLYSATVFKLTCVVELVSHVDTPVTVLTMWRKNNEVLRNSTRISVDSEATQKSSVITVYESRVLFDPLSNMVTSRDSGSYNCSAKIMDSEFVSGVGLNATKTLDVNG